MGNRYTETPDVAARIEAAERDRKQLTERHVRELLEKTLKLDVGIRMLVLEMPEEVTVGKIILVEKGEKMGAKRFMVLKPSKDYPSEIKNADWKIAALTSGNKPPMQLDVREVKMGDFVWAPPYAASKIRIVLSDAIADVSVLNWGDVVAILPKE